MIIFPCPLVISSVISASYVSSFPAADENESLFPFYQSLKKIKEKVLFWNQACPLMPTNIVAEKLIA